MELLKTLALLAFAAANYHGARPFAIWLAEKRRPLFKVKPFTCAACLSFWFTALGVSAASYLLAHGLGLYAGCALGVLLGLQNYSQINDRINITP